MEIASPRERNEPLSRDYIVNGSSEMGIDLNQHIEVCIQAMKPRAAEIGVAGTA